MKAIFTATTLALLLSQVARLASAKPIDTKSGLVERQSSPVNDQVDDADDRVSYSSDWTHLTNQGSNYLDGTESYTKEPDGSYKITWPYVHEGLGQTFALVIYSSRKSDRGDFEVALSNGTVLGTGNAYSQSDEETKSETVYQLESTYIEGPAELVVTNKPSGDQSVLAVDYVSFRYNAP